MAQFNYNQFQSSAAQEESNSSSSTKVGYFKLKNDGDIAIARINIGSTDELMFAAVHTLNISGRWMKVTCQNPLNDFRGSCALCDANNADPNSKTISKASKKVYLPMIVSYRDPNAANGYTAPIPVIWERPAQFSREIANKLLVAGDLRNVLVLITRNGKAGDMQTTYSMDVLPATHPVFKPDMIPADFSAFNNFNIAKHSYWEKTAEEIQTFLTTGQFPEVAKPMQAPAPAPTDADAPVYTRPTPQYAAPATAAPSYAAPQSVPGTAAPYITPATNPVQTPVTPQYQTATSPAPAYAAPVAAPATEAVPNTPARNFSGFSF